MPAILFVKGWKFFFFSNEGNEPIHIHVQKGERSCKYCKEFVNADSIAAGLSPFHPEAVSFEAGRLMLKRITQLIKEEKTFAFETTLSSKIYVQLVDVCMRKGYKVELIFFWLSSVKLAKERIRERVKRGGHFIPNDVVKRRYYRGRNKTTCSVG